MCSFIFYPMNGQVKWQTLSRLSALEQRFKRRNSQAKQQDRLQIQFNGKLKDDWYYLSSRLYAAIETIMPCGSVSQGIKLKFVC